MASWLYLCCRKITAASVWSTAGREMSRGRETSQEAITVTQEKDVGKSLNQGTKSWGGKESRRPVQ